MAPNLASKLCLELPLRVERVFSWVNESPTYCLLIVTHIISTKFHPISFFYIFSWSRFLLFLSSYLSYITIGEKKDSFCQSLLYYFCKSHYMLSEDYEHIFLLFSNRLSKRITL
uniref:Uncharacterized protein n=1 Tax=Nelumbo nucifera TaxID=4432 RepID=A0A822ZXV7_NELNU|nr:TPA_asm: hypothetical protein HUJ06_016685 [Nelumbo nucifera]